MELEKFVQENREAFDKEMPKMLVWEGIEARLNEIEQPKEILTPKTKVVSLRTRLYRYAKVAAIGLVLLTVGGFIGSYWTMQNQTEQLSFGTINEEYEELEIFYADKVNMQLEQLKKYRFEKSIINDIDELDEAYKELEKELKQEGNEVDNEMIINEMIDNYQAKVNILERVLDRLERNKQQTVKNKKNEKVSL